MIQLIPPEQFETAQAALREEIGRHRPKVVNIETTMNLFGPQVLYFRGRGYEVPPVPFEEGLRLVRLQRRLQDAEGDATPERVEELRAVLTEVAELFPLLVRRRGLLRWLPVRRPKRMTEGEALFCLGFLLGCRMIDLARSRSPRTDRHPSPIT